MIALIVVSLVACIAVGLIQERRVRRFEAERDEAIHDADVIADEMAALRALVRDQFAIVPCASSANDLLRILDMHRPMGVSMQQCLDEMQKRLDRKDYPRAS